jgi:hypothetical protein
MQYVMYATEREREREKERERKRERERERERERDGSSRRRTIPPFKVAPCLNPIFWADPLVF